MNDYSRYARITLLIYYQHTRAHAIFSHFPMLAAHIVFNEIFRAHMNAIHTFFCINQSNDPRDHWVVDVMSACDSLLFPRENFKLETARSVLWIILKLFKQFCITIKYLKMFFVLEIVFLATWNADVCLNVIYL